MIDRPAIFSAPMVRGLLREVEAAGTGKTMTRRLAWRFVGAGYPTDEDLIRKPSPWQKVQPGDRLWVRENIYQFGGPIEYPADGAPSFKRKMTPSIHMPRRLSDEDAIAEGIESSPSLAHPGHKVWCDYHRPHDPFEWFAGPANSFRTLWEKLHGIESWNANPEVVALTFTVHKTNIDQMERAA